MSANPSVKIQNRANPYLSLLGRLGHFVCAAWGLLLLLFSLNTTVVALEAAHFPGWAVLACLLTAIDLAYLVLSMRIWRADQHLASSHWPGWSQLLALVLVWSVNVVINMSFVA